MEFFNSNGIKRPARSYPNVRSGKFAIIPMVSANGSVIRTLGNALPFPHFRSFSFGPIREGHRVEIPFDNGGVGNLRYLVHYPKGDLRGTKYRSSRPRSVLTKCHGSSDSTLSHRGFLSLPLTSHHLSSVTRHQVCLYM